MKKIIQTLLVLTSGSLLFSCALPATSNESESINSSGNIEDTSSSNQSDTSKDSGTSSSGEQEEISMSFSNAYSLLMNKARENERDFASSETKIEKERKNDFITTVETKNKIYSDETSSLEQKTTKEDSKNNTKTEESASGRSLYQIDKIETGELNEENKPIVGEYPMYYFAFLSSNESNSYVAKKFVVDTEEEAKNGGLAAGEYVLASEKSYESSLKLSEDLASYLASLITSQYVIQTGITSFNGVEKENGIEYTMGLSYSYDGDLGNDTITMKEECTFLVSENRLIEYNYQTTLTDSAEGEDPYIKIISKEGKITYGEKENSYTGSLNPNDYFLTEIDEIGIVDGYGNEVDKNNISKKLYYVFAKPLSYLPKNAIGVSKEVLTPISSSNENAIAIANETMEIKGEGKTTITLTYFGKNEENIWQNKTKTIDLIVERPKGNGIYIQTDPVPNNIIGLGKEITFDVDVLPLEAIQDIEATSSDSKIISVTWNNGKATIKGEGLGEATITFFIKSNTAISKSITLKCQEAIDQDWFNSNVLNHTFKVEKTTYTLKLTFLENGNGQAKQVMKNNSDDFDDTFSYQLDNEGKLSLTNWSHDYGYSTDPNDYESETVEKATIFINANGKICIKIYRPLAYTYDTFERID
mgnify:CR=1 FL=1